MMEHSDPTLTPLSRVQREVLQAIIHITNMHGSAPPMEVVNRHMKRKVDGTIRKIVKLGYIAQPFGRGCVLPIYDVEGKPFAKMRLAYPTGEEPKEHTITVYMDGELVAMHNQKVTSNAKIDACKSHLNTDTPLDTPQ